MPSRATADCIHFAAASAMGKQARGVPRPLQLASARLTHSQVLTTQTSSPLPRFPRSNRDDVQKLYLSREHAKLQAGSASPGPVYAGPPSLGLLESHVHKLEPAIKIGTAKRGSILLEDTPGPGAYDGEVRCCASRSTASPAADPLVLQVVSPLPRFRQVPSGAAFGTSDREKRGKGAAHGCALAHRSVAPLTPLLDSPRAGKPDSQTRIHWPGEIT